MEFNKKGMSGFFHYFSRKSAAIMGQPVSFTIAFFSVFIWLLFGFAYDFSNTWQLVINSITSIITFLIVFLIQNTQNREVETMQVKLDELIRTQKGAKRGVLDLDELSDEELGHLEDKYKKLYTHYKLRRMKK